MTNPFTNCTGRPVSCLGSLSPLSRCPLAGKQAWDRRLVPEMTLGRPALQQGRGERCSILQLRKEAQGGDKALGWGSLLRKSPCQGPTSREQRALPRPQRPRPTLGFHGHAPPLLRTSPKRHSPSSTVSQLVIGYRAFLRGHTCLPFWGAFSCVNPSLQRTEQESFS